MIKTNFYLQFFLIIFIYIFPPILAPFFAKSAQILRFGTFSPWTTICLITSLILFQTTKTPSANADGIEYGSKKLKLILYSAHFFLTFGLLCTTAAVLEFIGVLLKTKTQAEIVLPSTFLEWIFCAATIAVAAFYEEVIYRAYLPSALNKFAKGKKIAIATAESACVLLFALAHSHNGALAVLNAIFAGIVLRRCAIKTQGIFTGFFAHLLYNCISIFALIV